MKSLQQLHPEHLRFLMESNVGKYPENIKPFFRYLDKNGMAVNDESIRSYFKWLRKSSYAPRTIAVRQSAVKSVLIDALEHADVPMDQYKQVLSFFLRLNKSPETKKPSVQSGITRDRYLTKPEVERLLKFIYSVSDRYYIQFLYVTGCRVSEMIGIRLSDCKIRKDKVIISIQGKGDKYREVRVPRALYDALRAHFEGLVYLFETSGQKPLSRSYVSNRIKKHGKRIGKEISAHTLRHSFFMYHLQNNKNEIASISKYAGHASVKTSLDFYMGGTLDDETLFSVST